MQDLNFPDIKTFRNGTEKLTGKSSILETPEGRQCILIGYRPSEGQYEVTFKDSFEVGGSRVDLIDGINLKNFKVIGTKKW